MMKYMLLLTFILGLLLAGKLFANSPQTKTFRLSPSSPTDAWNPTLEPGQEATLTVNVTSSASHNGYTYNLSGSPSYTADALWSGSMNGNSGSFSAIMPTNLTQNATMRVSCRWEPQISQGGGTNSVPTPPPTPINGGGTATISDQPLDVLIVWSIHPSDGFRKADGQEKYEFEINALDGEGEPVQVDFTGLTPDNATPATPSWTITGGTGSNTDHVEGEITSTTGSKGNLKIAYTFNGSPDDDTSAQELRFLNINISIKKSSDTNIPQNGLISIKGNTLTFSLDDDFINSGALSSNDAVWEYNKLKADGSFSGWTSFGSGGEQFNHSFSSSGIYLVRVTLFNDSNNRHSYLRKNNAPHGDNSAGSYNNDLLAGKPDYIGIVDNTWQIDIRNTAYSQLGKTDWSQSGSLSGSTIGYGVSTGYTAGPGSDKCNIFVFMIANSAGASVPTRVWRDWHVGIPPYTDYDIAPTADQWNNSTDNTTGWTHISNQEYPQPGWVVSRKHNITGSHHVGILDYDGTWINAGASKVNKFIHLNNQSYQPALFRKK